MNESEKARTLAGPNSLDFAKKKNLSAHDLQTKPFVLISTGKMCYLSGAIRGFSI